VRALTRYEMSLPRRFHADGLLTVSRVLADRFEETGFPRTRIRPINYGYDATLFRLSREIRLAPDSKPVVAMHGSFDEHHLGPIALEALKRVNAVRPDVEFRFIGAKTPALARFSSRLRAACPGVRLTLTGFVSYTEVASQLVDATVGIVPYEESRGTHCAFVAKLVESLAVGLPVVSTPLEAMQRHFRNEPAVKFSGFDGGSFAAAILAWLDSPAAERERLGRAAGERVRRELDWPFITANAAVFVEEIVGPPSSSAN
jgi:glycosyltransferase involved in cell wall biosynthesis